MIDDPTSIKSPERAIPQLFQVAVIIGTLSLPFHKTTSNIALAAAAVLGLIIFLREREFSFTVAVLPIAMFFIYGLSIFYSDDKKEGVRIMELGVTWLYIPLIFGFGGQYLSKRWRDQVVIMFSLAVLLLCAICYGRIIFTTGRYLPYQQDTAYTYYDPFSRYSFTEWIDFHPTYLSMYLLFAMVMIFEKSKLYLIWKFASILLIAFFLIILSSKNQLLVFLPLSCLLIWRAVKMSVLLKCAIVLMALVAILYWGLQSDQIRYRFGNEMATNSGERATFWAAGTSLFLQHPFIGTGIGDGQHAIDGWMMDHDREDLLDYNLHNQFLDFLVYFGVCGVSIFAILLALPLFRRVDVAFTIFIFITFTSSMTEAILVRQKGLCFFVLVYGMMGANYPLRKRP